MINRRKDKLRANWLMVRNVVLNGRDELASAELACDLAEAADLKQVMRHLANGCRRPDDRELWLQIMGADPLIDPKAKGMLADLEAHMRFEDLPTFMRGYWRPFLEHHPFVGLCWTHPSNANLKPGDELLKPEDLIEEVRRNKTLVRRKIHDTHRELFYRDRGFGSAYAFESKLSSFTYWWLPQHAKFFHPRAKGSTQLSSSSPRNVISKDRAWLVPALLALPGGEEIVNGTAEPEARFVDTTPVATEPMPEEPSVKQSPEPTTSPWGNLKPTTGKIRRVIMEEIEQALPVDEHALREAVTTHADLDLDNALVRVQDGGTVQVLFTLDSNELLRIARAAGAPIPYDRDVATAKGQGNTLLYRWTDEVERTEG